MTVSDPDELRAANRATWETAAPGWGRRADYVREWGMPVSVAMLDGLRLQPGHRVLELAAGTGDTGFMAAELIRPGGTLITSDGAETMLQIARTRAAEAGVRNVEFRQLELEWIDLETATVDAVLCRWGIMLLVDPEAAAREIRRVLRPGGRAAVAVWDSVDHNPWATLLTRALVELGYTDPPDPDLPGPFALGAEGQLEELLEDAGFTDVEATTVAVTRRCPSLKAYVEEAAEMSPSFSERYRKLDDAQRAAVVERVTADARPYTAPDGTITLPGRSHVAIAEA